MINQKKVCICADDFGLSGSISEGIIDLVSKKKIQAVSCILNKKIFPKYYKKLKRYKNKVDIGLHINLTENDKGINLKFDNLLNFFKTLFLIFFKKRLIVKEIKNQINEFEKYFKFKPKHIDGHHHIHQLPIINLLIINSILDFKPFVRQSGDSISNILSRKICIIKSIIISFFSSKLIMILKKNKIKYNKSFSGIYDFKKNLNFKFFFKYFLIQIEDNHLIMCHPAKKLKVENYNDTIFNSRLEEYSFYMSRKFNKIKKNKNFKFIQASKF